MCLSHILNPESWNDVWFVTGGLSLVWLVKPGSFTKMQMMTTNMNISKLRCQHQINCNMCDPQWCFCERKMANSKRILQICLKCNFSGFGGIFGKDFLRWVRLIWKCSMLMFMWAKQYIKLLSENFSAVAATAVSRRSRQSNPIRALTGQSLMLRPGSCFYIIILPSHISSLYSSSQWYMSSSWPIHSKATESISLSSTFSQIDLP